MKKIARLSAIILMTLSALLMSGCDWLLSDLGVSGKVVNARAAKAATNWWEQGTATLVGATITFTNLGDNTEVSGTVDSFGEYLIENVPAGRYSITGVKSGWIFVPRTVDISGFASTMPDVLAYVNPGATEILLIAEWENRDVDIDMHLVIDDTDTDTLDPANTTASSILDTVNYLDPTSPGVTLERDIAAPQLADDLPAVETILIDSNPLAGGDSTGWLRLYLNAYLNQYGLTGLTGTVAEASAIVHVMQGDTWLGTFRLASESAEQMVCMVKISVDNLNNYTIMSPGNFNNTAKNLKF